MAQSANTEHLTGEVVQLGTVASVDHDGATCTVAIGDLVTGDLPWLTWRAGRVTIWAPPSASEQCAVHAPEGDLAVALVLPGLFLIKFDDGAVISYHMGDHALTVTLPSGGTAQVDAPGGLTINADVTINGNVQMKARRLRPKMS